VNYKKLQATAQRLIGANGTKCVLNTPSGKPPAYNPATNEYESDDKHFDGVCVISGYEDSMVDGTIIQAGDRKIVAVLAGEPVPKLSTLDIYDRNNVLKDSYKIINVNPKSPDATTVIAYLLQCRK